MAEDSKKGHALSYSPRLSPKTKTSSINIVQKIARALYILLDFLAGDASVLVKDKKVLQRIEDISRLSKDRKKHLRFYRYVPVGF